MKYGLTLQKCLALGVAWDYADEQDKSTAWMLQYMQDVAGVELDAVNGQSLTQAEAGACVEMLATSVCYPPCS